MAGLVATTATGCDSGQFKRLGLPQPATKEAPIILHLWQGSWIAALAVGALVWGLILWCVIFYRRKRTGIEIPAQTRYNLPIEVLFTVVPFIMIAVLFFFTAKDESKLLALHKNPAVNVNVVGRQWSWAWNYNYDAVTKQETPQTGIAVYDAGTPADLPVLWLPVNERARFTLTSPDVIHSFWVPNFLFKMDVVPGPGQRVRAHPDQGGRVHRPVRRAVRRRPLPDAVQGQGRFRGRLPGAPAGPGRQGRPGDRQGPDRSAAHRPDPEHDARRSRRRPHRSADRRRQRLHRERKVTAISEPRAVSASYERRVPGNIVVKWITSTDHKVIGYMYLITSFCFFCIGGVLALLMRAELARPGLQFLTTEQYNQLFTMHGTIMLLLFATPLFVGFANVDHAAADRRARTWRSRG